MARRLLIERTASVIDAVMKEGRYTVNRRNKGIWIAAALVAGLAPFFPALVGGEEREVTLVGTVIESDWDEDGNAIAVELRTDDEVYSIASVGRGADLLSYDGQLVEVVGTVSVDDDGWNVLSVSSFTLLEPDEI
jgi:hypothetical protein